MDPVDYVELARRLGIDAIVAHTGGWLSGGRYEHTSDGARHYVGGSATTEKELLAEPFDRRDAESNVSRYAAAAQESDVAVMAWLPGVVTGPAIGLGYDVFALALHDDPDMVERVCDAQTLRTLLALDGAAGSGATVAALGDDISDSNGPMMSPDRLRALWLPRARAVVDRAHRRSLPIMLHCCGHLKVVMPLAAEAGFDAIQPVAACNDVVETVAAARSRLAVAGTVDVGSVLVRGDPEAVAAAVRGDWAAYGPSGFILGSNHSINDAVPVGNLWALAHAVAELG
jgi:uroporphyrinogen decarboxylase